MKMCIRDRYRLQGVEINDKHIEVIVRQMLKKIRIEEAGDTEFLPGTNVDILEFEDVNKALEDEGKEPATGEQIMLGITKASLATNSFLSAASFQETTKAVSYTHLQQRLEKWLKDFLDRSAELLQSSVLSCFRSRPVIPHFVLAD